MLKTLELERAAVIGDIHGRLDLLDPLLERLGDRPILTAGDVCDRGPNTAACVELLIQYGALGVRGNHEQWLIDWVSERGFDPMALHHRMGGAATLESYGVDPESERLEAAWRRVPQRHRDWLCGLPYVLDLKVADTPYWVIHAGVPGVFSFSGLLAEEVVPHLLAKHPSSLLWSKTDPELMPWVDRTVIMGHVPIREPFDDGHVIAVDTGAGRWASGGLSAVLLPEREFVTVYP